MADITVQEVIRLFETIQMQVIKAVENSAAAKESAGAAKESAALALRKVIDLEQSFQDFQTDTMLHRTIREEWEREDATRQYEAAQKKLQAIVPNQTTAKLSTQERIDKAVATQIAKDRIDWKGIWREKVIPSIVVLTVTTFWGAILFIIGSQILLPAMQKAFGN